MKNKRVWIFLALAVLVLVLNYCFGWSAQLSNPQTLPALRAALEENRILALFLYMGLTAVGCVLLALPGVVFALAAGMLFGPVLGTLACSVATTLGACLSFLAGRYFLRDALKPRLEKNKYLNRLLFQGTGERDLFLLAVTRLVPIFPYNLQNFAYGITDIRFSRYAFYSALFMLPGTAVYTVGAAGVLDPAKRLPYFLFAGGLLVVVLLASFVLKKRVVEKENLL